MSILITTKCLVKWADPDINYHYHTATFLDSWLQPCLFRTEPNRYKVILYHLYFLYVRLVSLDRQYVRIITSSTYADQHLLCIGHCIRFNHFSHVRPTCIKLAKASSMICLPWLAIYVSRSWSGGQWDIASNCEYEKDIISSSIIDETCNWTCLLNDIYRTKGREECLQNTPITSPSGCFKIISCFCLIQLVHYVYYVADIMLAWWHHIATQILVSNG